MSALLRRHGRHSFQPYRTPRWNQLGAARSVVRLLHDTCCASGKGFGSEPKATSRTEPNNKLKPKYVIMQPTSEAKLPEAEDSWRQMDQKVNKYPMQRTFTAIGSGGEDFRDAMVATVAQHLGTVDDGCVTCRPSSENKYVSVRIGPVWVQNPEQVVAIFASMKLDVRLKWSM